MVKKSKFVVVVSKCKKKSILPSLKLNSSRGTHFDLASSLNSLNLISEAAEKAGNTHTDNYFSKSYKNKVEREITAENRKEKLSDITEFTKSITTSNWQNKKSSYKTPSVGLVKPSKPSRNYNLRTRLPKVKFMMSNTVTEFPNSLEDEK